MKHQFLTKLCKKAVVLTTSAAMIFSSVGISGFYTKETVKAAVTGLPFANNKLGNGDTNNGLNSDYTGTNVYYEMMRALCRRDVTVSKNMGKNATTSNPYKWFKNTQAATSNFNEVYTCNLTMAISFPSYAKYDKGITSNDNAETGGPYFAFALGEAGWFRYSGYMKANVTLTLRQTNGEWVPKGACTQLNGAIAYINKTDLETTGNSVSPDADLEKDHDAPHITQHV